MSFQNFNKSLGNVAFSDNNIDIVKERKITTFKINDVNFKKNFIKFHTLEKNYMYLKNDLLFYNDGSGLLQLVQENDKTFNQTKPFFTNFDYDIYPTLIKLCINFLDPASIILNGQNLIDRLILNNVILKCYNNVVLQPLTTLNQVNYYSLKLLNESYITPLNEQIYDNKNNFQISLTLKIKLENQTYNFPDDISTILFKIDETTSIYPITIKINKNNTNMLDVLIVDTFSFSFVNNQFFNITLQVSEMYSFRPKLVIYFNSRVVVNTNISCSLKSLGVGKNPKLSNNSKNNYSFGLEFIQMHIFNSIFSFDEIKKFNSLINNFNNITTIELNESLTPIVEYEEKIESILYTPLETELKDKDLKYPVRTEFSFKITNTFLINYGEVFTLISLYNDDEDPYFITLNLKKDENNNLVLFLNFDNYFDEEIESNIQQYNKIIKLDEQYFIKIEIKKTLLKINVNDSVQSSETTIIDEKLLNLTRINKMYVGSKYKEAFTDYFYNFKEGMFFYNFFITNI